jgi:hypothetical protein
MAGSTGRGQWPFQPSGAGKHTGELEGAVSMITQEEFMEVQVLRSAGWSIRQIAEHVGFTRRR